MINLFLERMFLKESYCIGMLSIGTMHFCDTLEDKVRDLNKDGDLDDEGEGKVYGETAIPYGRYRVVVTYSHRLKRELPLILDVQHFTGIRMHKLRSAKGTLGCVGLGDNTGKGILTNGEYYEKKLTSIIKEATLRGERVWINIV